MPLALSQIPVVSLAGTVWRRIKILDPLVEEVCVEPVPLGQPSAAASPAFIIWNRDKPRLVVDLRKLNTKLYPEAYSLPRQDDVLGTSGGSTILDQYTYLSTALTGFAGKLVPSLAEELDVVSKLSPATYHDFGLKVYVLDYQSRAQA